MGITTDQNVGLTLNSAAIYWHQSVLFCICIITGHNGVLYILTYAKENVEKVGNFEIRVCILIITEIIIKIY